MSNKLSISIQSSTTHSTADFKPDGSLRDGAIPDEPTYDIVVSDNDGETRFWIGEPPYPANPEALFKQVMKVRCIGSDEYDNIMFAHSIQKGIEVDGTWFEYDEWKHWLTD